MGKIACNKSRQKPSAANQLKKRVSDAAKNKAS
jgi:hypothetical protein